MANVKTCPYCNSLKVAKLQPAKGNKYFIGCCDTNNNTVYATDGTAVDLYGCVDCKKIFIEDPALKLNL